MRRLEIPEMLSLAFVKAELKVLEDDFRFTSAAAKAVTLDDFRELCELAECILIESRKTNPAAKQFRTAFLRNLTAN
jgi:hypothetical protein